MRSPPSRTPEQRLICAYANLVFKVLQSHALGGVLLDCVHLDRALLGFLRLRLVYIEVSGFFEAVLGFAGLPDLWWLAIKLPGDTRIHPRQMPFAERWVGGCLFLRY